MAPIAPSVLDVDKNQTYMDPDVGLPVFDLILGEEVENWVVAAPDQVGEALDCWVFQPPGIANVDWFAVAVKSSVIAVFSKPLVTLICPKADPAMTQNENRRSKTFFMRVGSVDLNRL